MKGERAHFDVDRQVFHKQPFAKGFLTMLIGYARVSRGDEQNNALQI